MAIVTELDTLSVGTDIEVRCHFTCAWSPGFEVAEAVVEDGQQLYRIRRRSDRAVLPVAFPGEHLRRAHRWSPDSR